MVMKTENLDMIGGQKVMINKLGHPMNKKTGYTCYRDYKNDPYYKANKVIGVRFENGLIYHINECDLIFGENINE